MTADADRQETASKAELLPRLGWLAALLVPPSALTGFFHDLVREHYVVAAVLFLGYAVVLTAGRFAGGFARDLVAMRRRRWLDSADSALSRRMSSFGRVYTQFLAQSLRVMEQKGLATIGHYAPELDDVYVNVSLAYRAPGQIPEDVLTDHPTDERRSITDFLDGEQGQVLAVVGAPGTGKTTLLRHTARRACLARERRTRGVPVLLYLRSVADDLVANERLPLADVIRSGLGRYAQEEPPGWFEERLEAGDCLVLLDGLDEVADLLDRRIVVNWVERQIKEYPGNDYVITSRPRGYLSAPVEGATVLQTRQFTDEQMARFIHSWYLAVERHASPEGAEDTTSRAEDQAGDLLTRLRANPDLYDLTVNPLLLTMIANVHRYRGALPGSRADLYREICQVMLWRRHDAKQLVVQPRGAQKETVLRELAFKMMTARTATHSRSQCEEALRQVLPRVSAQLTAEAFLDDVSSNGLLVEREKGLYGFAHLTIQEYLAAEHVREKGLVETLVDAVEDDWWRECTLLYAAGADVGPVVEAGLRAGSVSALALAFECAEEGNELDPELRARLERLLDAPADARFDDEHRKLVDGVFLLRRLRGTKRTGDGGRLCAPVDAHTYARFLRDRGGWDGAARPDCADVPADHEVVTGVRWRDARAFVDWVNETVGGPARFRLPHTAEMDPQQVYDVWTAEPPDGLGRDPLWVGAARLDPRRVTTAELQARVGKDVSGPSLALSLRTAVLVMRVRRAVKLVVRLTTDTDQPLRAQWAHLEQTLSTLHRQSLALDPDFGLGVTDDLAAVDAVARHARQLHLDDCNRFITLLEEDVLRELGSLPRRLTEGRNDEAARSLSGVWQRVQVTVQELSAPGSDQRRRQRRPHLDLVETALAGDLASAATSRSDGDRFRAAARRSDGDRAATAPRPDAATKRILALRKDVYALDVGGSLSLAASRYSARLHHTPSDKRDTVAFELPLGSPREWIAEPHQAARRIGPLAHRLVETVRGDAAAHRFLAEQARAVDEHAVSLLRRGHRPDARTFRRARLALAILAAEAERPSDRGGPGDEASATEFRFAAASLAWLEDRYDRARPASESIVLLALD
ncbi:NACHT domain-containing protein [Streptomyces sp. cg35]|uniref:NACHT domain-containing protein n=1 Tax=Streptomyces sp. cg35 TaxID=3421650 RepID=UPI003D1787F8